MILEQKNTTVSYRCPACGANVKSMVGAFSLSGDLMRLKCPCGESDMTIEKLRDGRIRLTIPCFLCPRPHIYTVSEKVFFADKTNEANKENEGNESGEVFAFPCSYTGFDIGFVGSEKEIDKANSDADMALAELLEEADFEDVTCHNKERIFDDPQILDIIMFVVDDLAAEGKIYCDCEGGKGDYEVSVTDDSVIVKCKKCGCYQEIPASSSIEANAFLHCDDIHLTQKM